MEGNQFNEEQNNIVKLFRILLKRKWFITLGTVGTVVLITAFVFIMPDVFESTAVISLGETEKGAMTKGIEIPVFTGYLNVFKNPELFREFLKNIDYQEEWKVDTDFFDTRLTPVYAFDKKSRVKQTEDSVLGIEITCIGPDAQQARDKSTILGEYILTTILNKQLRLYFESLKSSSRIAIANSANAILALNFEIKNLAQKEALINEELLKIPGIAQKTDRELVNVDEKTEKYLSPQQQLVAVKMTVQEIEIQIAQNLRTEKINQNLLAYTSEAAAAFNNVTFLIDRNLLDTLLTIKQKYFTGREDEESIVADNLLSVRFIEFEKLKNVDHAFISSPTLPEKPFKPKRMRFAIAGFFLALFSFIFLSIFLEKWQNLQVRGSQTGQDEI